MLVVNIIVVLKTLRVLFHQKETKMLKSNCTKCKTKKSMAVSDTKLEAEESKDFFKSVGNATVNFGKKFATNPVRALEIESKKGIVAATKKPRAALVATPDLIKFATTVEGITVVQKRRGLFFWNK